MGKEIELRRHTDADGDVLTADGVTAAVEIGARLGAGTSSPRPSAQFGPQPMVEDALFRRDGGEVGELRSQRDRAPAHERIVSFSSDVEATRAKYDLREV